MKFPMADAHCDFLYYMAMEGIELGTLSPHQVIHLPYLKQGGVCLLYTSRCV